VLVDSADDILGAIGSGRSERNRQGRARAFPALSREEETVFRFIQNEPKHIDSIMKESGTAAGKLSGILINLELKGLVKQLPGKYYLRTD
jgi:DNA processing protein